MVVGGTFFKDPQKVCELLSRRFKKISESLSHVYSNVVESNANVANFPRPPPELTSSG
jgi:hypothetical protein